MREAIRLLAASGLVETRAHRAAVVARPTPERLVGMFEAMAELEALCAGLAAERMTGAERRELEAAHEKLRALIHRAIRSATTRSTRRFTAPSMPARTTPIWPS